MIDAVFDRMSRTAAISGVYQYDTGQRLIMHGLPTPEELGEEDDLLSGDLATVQTHFAYDGEAQSVSCLTRWDDDRMAWVAVIPDEFLRRHEDVHVYVSVYYGSAEGGSRSRTMYEAVFRPNSRPAPDDTVSDSQLEQWEDKEIELQMAVTGAETAITNADEKAAAAQTAADAAYEAAIAAQDAELEASNAGDDLATAAYERVMATPPEAADGQKGEQGDPGQNGPTDITITFSAGVLTITPKEG